MPSSTTITRSEQRRRALRAYPNQALFPAFALALTMFAFNFLGDGLRDALEPRLRGTQEE